MLIVNADDLGRCRLATDRILSCYVEKRLSATSAMVFMEDSERAAACARTPGIDVGLHINFTETFTGKTVPEKVRQQHDRIRKFLRASKYALLLYHPFLRKQFRALFEAQLAEFVRLYGNQPSHMDGHQHMHLCSNMLLDKIIPQGVKIRRSFSFRPGEKSLFNRAYRNLVDRRLNGRYRTPDYFFALSQHLPVNRLDRVVELAQTRNVELMTHPELDSEFEALMGESYLSTLRTVQMRSYSDL